MAAPELSVVVPVYRGRAFLPGAVSNILRQGVADLEILIVDDGSGDGTAEAAEQITGPIQVLRQEQRGPSAARNAGLRAARGEHVAFLDVDDLWPVGMLARMKSRLLKSGAAAVLGRTQYVKQAGGVVPDLRWDSPAQTLAYICTPAALFRRELFTQVGEFDEKLRLSEDHDWFLRARECGVSIVIEAETTLLYRHHRTNTTREMKAAESGLSRVLAGSLKRRRAGGGGALAAWSTLERRAPRPRRAWDISVVIPAYNAARYIGAALQSVKAQSLAANEVIVVDDGSTDGTLEIVQRSGGVVRVLRQERGGAAAARNLGVREARGEWVAFLDADDYWLPDRLAWQAQAVEADSGLEVVYGCVQQFYSPDLEWPDTTAHEEAAAVQAGIFPGTCLVRRQSFERVGGFETGLRVGEFIDWHARASSAGLRMKTLDEVVMRRRIHDTNTGVREKQAQADYVRVLKAALDRRRAGRPA